MARMQALRIEVFDDAVGKPYVLIEGTTEDASGTDAVPMEFKVWAHEVTVTDHRKPKGPVHPTCPRCGCNVTDSGGRTEMRCINAACRYVGPGHPAVQ